MQFQPMTKIGRKSLSMIITEKMDGTNASIHIIEAQNYPLSCEAPIIAEVGYNDKKYIIFAASRNRWISSNKNGEKSDNYGFACWASENADELVKLGIGAHFGEWYGEGIQKNPHKVEGKHFALFNTYRWKDPYLALKAGRDVPNFPNCVEVVRELYHGPFSERQIEITMLDLHRSAPLGKYKAEGVVIYIPEADHLVKRTFEFSKGKWKEAA